MSKKKALGRGLSALLSDSTPDEKLDVDIQSPAPGSKASSATSGIAEIPIGEIEVNPFQPRTHFDQEALQELSESIKVHGIIQPITVRRLTNNQYQLISGERRFQASKLVSEVTAEIEKRRADKAETTEARREELERKETEAAARRKAAASWSGGQGLAMTAKPAATAASSLEV